ncbi:RnfABCDGE type electron transport complex subunit D [Chitinophagales bacterium]|nr:RnfABCDGE type electron transport complex subunit D [Chitinophagales bacterium]
MPASKLKFPLNLMHFFNDARHFQIVYLGSFVLFGLVFLSWHEDWFKFILFAVTALVIQYFGQAMTQPKGGAWKSALITSLGLCLLCKTNTYETAILAAAFAIGSKFVLRYNGKHIFNPVNMGIIASIYLTNDAWISPGQWGSHIVLIFLLGALGFLVLRKVDRLDASLTFLLVFGGLQFVRSVLYLGWSIDVYLHQMASGTLLLFTFFMITDPMTTPNHRTARIIWVSLISVTSFALSNYIYVYAAPILVLFFASPLTPVLDTIWQSEKFDWKFSKSFVELKK